MRYSEGPLRDAPPKLNKRFARFETYLATRWGLDSIDMAPVIDALYTALKTTGQVRPPRKRKAKRPKVAKQGKLIVYDFAARRTPPNDAA